MPLLESHLGSAISSPGDIAAIFRSILRAGHVVDRDKEHLWVAGLSTRLKIKYIELVSLGITDASLVHAREVFRMAVINAAHSLILVHNHPAGDPLPSRRDEEITERMKDAGRILGIEVIDHIIIADDAYYSFEQGGSEAIPFAGALHE